MSLAMLASFHNNGYYILLNKKDELLSNEYFDNPSVPEVNKKRGMS